MASRYGTEFNDRLSFDFWLTFSRAAGRAAPGVKVSAGYPALARNERAMNIKIDLPIVLFETPSLTARIDVPHDLPRPVVDIGATADAIRAATGLDFDIRVSSDSE